MYQLSNDTSLTEGQYYLQIVFLVCHSHNLFLFQMNSALYIFIVLKHLFIVLKQFLAGPSLYSCRGPDQKSEVQVPSAQGPDSFPLVLQIAAPLRKGLAAGLLAATIATSSGPAYADDAIAKVEQRWGQITQKARKATSEAKSTVSLLSVLQLRHVRDTDSR
jgi:hypothetical protein